MRTAVIALLIGCGAPAMAPVDGGEDLCPAECVGCVPTTPDGGGAFSCEPMTASADCGGCVVFTRFCGDARDTVCARP